MRGSQRKTHGKSSSGFFPSGNLGPRFPEEKNPAGLPENHKFPRHHFSGTSWYKIIIGTWATKEEHKKKSFKILGLQLLESALALGVFSPHGDRQAPEGSPLSGEPSRACGP